MASQAPTAPHRLPAWVRELRRDRRASVALAADVADAVLAMHDPKLGPGAARHLTAIVERADQTGDGIPVSVAARLLDITEPTVRTWLERGVLDAVPDAKPVSITPRSLGEAMAAVSTIRRVGQDERMLRRVLEILEDQRTRAQLADRIEELDNAVEIDPDRIAEQVFGEPSLRSA